jgi:hypothetical protein
MVKILLEPLSKITDKTEIVPKLDEFTVYDWLAKFREYCLGKYADIAAPGFDRQKINKRLGLLNSRNDQSYQIHLYLMKSMGFDTKSYKVINCIVELLRNPRQLKRALAGTWTAWQQLHGEIYFDDLLVIHTIKASASALFHLMANNISRFKIFANRDTKVDNREMYQAVEQVLDSDNAPDKMLYHKLIQFLFPGWQIRLPNDKGERADYELAELHPQGIASGGKVDYFARAFAEELNENELSDQNVMRVLQDYNNSNIPAKEILSKALVSEQYAERIECFAKLLRPEKVLDITTEYFKIISELNSHSDLNKYDLTARLWRMSLDNPDSEAEYTKWLESQIDKYYAESLRFNNTIFYYWRSRTRSDVETKQRSPELYKMYVEKIKQLAKKPEEFIKALSSIPPYIWTLRHIVFMFEGNENIGHYAQQDKSIFSNWQPWIVDLLIKTAKNAPTIIPMYTAPLMYDANMSFQDDEEENQRRQGWVARFDETIARMLFGDDLLKIMKVISALKEDDYKGYSEIDGQARAILDFAVIHSKQWLKENKPVSED